MSNLRLATVVSLLSGARFGLGIWVLYYLRVTDYAGIGVVEAITIVTAFVAEVPAGVLADTIGRRRTLAASFAVSALAYTVLGLTTTFAMLCMALFLFAIGKALRSGTFEALVYESLADAGRELEYGLVIARMRSWRLGMMAVASIMGGYLYGRDPRLPYFAAVLAFGAGALVAMALREPDGPRRVQGRGWGERLRAGADLLRQACTARSLLGYLLLSGAILVVTEEIVDDVLAVELGFDAHQLGWLFAFVYLAAALASRRSYALARRWGRERVLLAVAVLVGLSLLISPWLGMLVGGTLVMGRYAARAVIDNLESEVLLESAPARARATSLSVFRMLKSAPYVVTAAAVGTAMQVYGAAGFAQWLGVGLLLVALLYSPLLVNPSANATSDHAE